MTMNSPVRRHVEPVDDAPQAQTTDLGFEQELDPHGVDGVRILEPEVVGHQRLGVGQEGLR